MTTHIIKPIDPDFSRNPTDFDPVTKRLTRDKWEQWERVLPPQSLDYDAIIQATNEDPAANATAAEIKTLITALETIYRELSEKLKVLKRDNPLAMMPGESEIKYRKRVPEAGALPPEKKWALVWPTNERRYLGRAIKALREGCQPYRLSTDVRCNEATYGLLQPFEQRRNKVYRARHDVEDARRRAIEAAKPVDDAAWEKYQQACDYNDARKQVEAAMSAECRARGSGTTYASIYGHRWYDIAHERAKLRAVEITRARHARMQQAAE